MVQSRKLKVAAVLIIALFIFLLIVSIWLNSLSQRARDSNIQKIDTLLVSGAVNGAILALLAASFNLLFGVAGILSLTQGTFVMLPMYFMYVFGASNIAPIGMVPAVFVSVFLTTVLGPLIVRLSSYPLLKARAGAVMASASAAWVVDRVIIILFGPSLKYVPPLVTGSVDVAGVRVTYSEILAIIVSVGSLALLALFLKRAKIGKAMRAVAQDRETALLMGISSQRIYMIAFLIAALMASSGGIFYILSTTGVANTAIWADSVTVAIPIVVLGGLGSLKGTVVAAFIIEYATSAFVLYAPGFMYVQGAVGMAIMIAILMIRPRGLFGKRQEMK